MSSRILFFVPFGAWSVHNQVDAVLATALKQRGAEVRLVGCDGIYPACDVLAWSGAEAAAHCSFCAKTGPEFFGRFGLSLTQMREYLKPEDFAAARAWADSIPPAEYATAVWQDLPIGQWVTSSVFSYFRITAGGLGQPGVQAVHRQFLANGVLTWQALSRIIDEFQPSRVCIFNARMAPFRVAFELAGRRGLNVMTHERGYVSDTFVLYENEDCLSTQPVRQCVDAWKDVPLTREECVLAQRYLLDREQGQGMNYPAFYSFQTESAAVRRALRLPEKARVLLVLTSTEYELACSEHFRNITGQLQALQQLLEVFRNRPEFLVVRHHPYIAGDKLVPPDYEFLANAYLQAGRAPDNVRVVMPSETVTTYPLFWVADACIAFFSTTGLEAEARGLPTAVFPESCYRQAVSRVIEETGTAQLTDLVDDLFKRSESFGTTELRRVYRFLHPYIARLPKRFKSLGVKNHFEADRKFASPEELRPGNDPELDRVCEHLLQGTPLLAGPAAADRARGPEEEEDFLRQQDAELKRQRAKTREKSHWRGLWQLIPPAAVVRLETAGKNSPHASALNGAAFRTRHREVRDYRCAVTGPGEAGLLARLVAALGEVQEHYVVVTHDAARHDEAFISAGVDQLLDDADCQLAGIMFGAWLAPDGRSITGEIFTRRVPAETFDDALRLLPALSQPQNLLPFGLFRRDRLVGLLQAAAGLAPEAATRQLFAALQTPAFRQTNLPMLVFSCSATLDPKPC